MKNTMHNPVTTFIADDHKLFAHSLKTMIEDETDYKVVKVVNNGKALMQALNAARPNLLILDINMPELDGIEALQRIKMIFSEIKILIVSYISTPSIISKVKQMGADGYFIKDDDPDLFLKALQDVVGGTPFFPKKGFEENSAEDVISKYQFTDREVEVMKLIKLNYATAEIASKLFISENTVKTHRKNICNKLNTSDFKLVYKFAIENF